MAKNKQGLIEGGLILTLALAVIKILGFVLKYLTNAIIGDVGYGFYTQAFSIYSVVYAISVTGFPVAISRVVSSYASQGRYNDVRRVIKVSRRLFAIVGIIGTGIQIAGAYWISNYAFNPPAPLVFWGIVASAPAVFFCCIMSAYRGYNQGLNNMKPTAVSQVVEVIGKFVASLAFALLAMKLTDPGFYIGKKVTAEVAAMGAAGAMLGITFSGLAAYLYLHFRYWRKGDGLTKIQINASPAPAPDRAISKTIVMIAIPIAISAVTFALAGLIDAITIKYNLNQIVNSGNLSVLMNSHRGYLDQYLAIKDQAGNLVYHIKDIPNILFGIYGYEGSMSTLISSITATFGVSALPLISALWVQKNKPELKKNINMAVRIVAIVAAPMGFGCVFLAEPISRFITPNAISGHIGAPILMMLGISGIFVALQTSINATLQGIGKQWTAVGLTAVGLVLKTVGNYILVGIPQFNIMMAPVGNILCFGFIVAAGLIAIMIYTKEKINIWGALIKPLIAGAATGVFALLAYNLMGKVIASNTVCTLGSIGIAVVIYVIMIGLLKVLERDDVLSLSKGEKIARTLEKLRIIR